MAVSILEALQNANYNLTIVQRTPQLLPLVKEQLNNAVTLLEMGYPLETQIEPLLERFGDAKSVPEYRSQDDGDGEPIPRHLDE